MKTALSIVQAFTMEAPESGTYASVIASFTTVDEEIDYLANTTDANYVKAYVEHIVSQIVTAESDEAQGKKIKEKTNKFVAFIKKHGATIAKGGFIFAAFATMVSGFIFALKRGKIPSPGSAIGKIYDMAIKAVTKGAIWIGEQVARLSAKTPELKKKIQERLRKIGEMIKNLRKVKPASAGPSNRLTGPSAPMQIGYKAPTPKPGRASRSRKQTVLDVG